ncbi:MAG: hypothetical protein R2749_17830 [Acidimicrobiales bacterium]
MAVGHHRHRGDHRQRDPRLPAAVHEGDERTRITTVVEDARRRTGALFGQQAADAITGAAGDSATVAASAASRGLRQHAQRLRTKPYGTVDAERTGGRR